MRAEGCLGRTGDGERLGGESEWEKSEEPRTRLEVERRPRRAGRPGEDDIERD